MVDWKQIGAAVGGGAIVKIVGDYLVPVVNSLLTFVPQKELVLGITPHMLVAYGVGMFAAMWVGKKLNWM